MAMATTMEFRARASPSVETLRFQTPSVAFPERAHGHPPRHPLLDLQQPSTTFTSSWISHGPGARHISDIAPFSLWDETNQDFRNPTRTERQWVITTYNARTVTYAFPEIIIRTSNLPSPVPLTIAGLVAVFLSLEAFRNPLGVSTDYANPRLPDPVSHLQLVKWELPARAMRAEIYEGLRAVANIKAIYYIPPTIFVELVPDDDRVYDRHSLPGVVGGIPTEYHHSSTPFLKMAAQGRERLMDPGPNSAQDTTNYYDTSGLSPGVRVEGARVHMRQRPWQPHVGSSSFGVIWATLDSR